MHRLRVYFTVFAKCISCIRISLHNKSKQKSILPRPSINFYTPQLNLDLASRSRAFFLSFFLASTTSIIVNESHRPHALFECNFPEENVFSRKHDSRQLKCTRGGLRDLVHPTKEP